MKRKNRKDAPTFGVIKMFEKDENRGSRGMTSLWVTPSPAVKNVSQVMMCLSRTANLP